MTDDLVGRLRLQAKHGLWGVPNDHKFVGFAEAAARIEALEGEKAEWLGIMRHLVEGRGRDLARAIIAKEDANVRS